MKIILTSDGDVVGQAEAAEYVLREWTRANPGDRIGVRVKGRYYGVRWNKGSISIYPQAVDTVAATPVPLASGGPGHGG